MSWKNCKVQGDLTVYIPFQIFTGHATEVFKMLHIPTCKEDLVSIDNTYFISAAVNDRLVNAW